MTPAAGARPSAGVAWAWFAYLAFVVYGSLVPLDFRFVPFDEAWQTFRQTPWLALGVESRADWVANGVLYLPVGLLGAQALRKVVGLVGAVCASFLVGCVLAFSVEFAQIYFPPRTVSQNDLIAEALGCALGAAAAVQVGPWVERWRRAWGRDLLTLAKVGLLAYAVAYVAYSFFPFDVLLSRAELADKLAADSWGWLIAGGADRSAFRTALQWAVECALTLPIGIGLALWRRRATTWRAGAMAGLALGLVIEVGQLFIATGISQGMSLVSRALGAGLGVHLVQGWKTGGWADVRYAIFRHVGLLGAGYLLLLLPAAGIGRYAFGNWNHAVQAWQDLRLMPFYYHYFTTEAMALTSLGSTVLMYAPIAVLAWGRHMPMAGMVMLTTFLALAIESAKLFMVGTHPDPTNVLLAVASVACVRLALGQLDEQLRHVRLAPGAGGREPLQPMPVAALPEQQSALPAARDVLAPAPPSAQSAPWRRLFRVEMAAGWICVALVLLMALRWPSHAVVLSVGLLLAALVCAWKPAVALFLLPMAMPLLDLAPWTGRFFLDEFDFLCAACLMVALLASRARLADALPRGLGGLAFAGLGLVLLVGALRPAFGADAVDLNSFSHYHSAFGGVRIVKGALWAWLFCTLYAKLVDQQSALAHWWPMGVAAGLAGTVAYVVWERAAMVGLWNFAADYRVTGPFSVMNKGGAYIECFLAVAMAIVLVQALSLWGRRMFWPVAVLLAAASYALFVTYSRNGYAALLVGLLVVLASAWKVGRRGAIAAVVLLSLAIGLVALPVLQGSFAQQRLAQSKQDLAVRWSHWMEALALRENTLTAELLGEGLGQFPVRHAWHSLGKQRAAAFRLEPGDGNPYLRLGPGAAVYIEQIVDVPEGKPLNLTLNIRSNAQSEPTVSLTLCRKTMLTSSDCEQVTVRGIKAKGIWQTQYAEVPPLPAAESGLQALVPVKLSISTPASGAVIDVDNVSLFEPEGKQEYLRNGSFRAGMDHWFFATDVDPPWHIHSLPLAVLFDLGWFGVCASALVLIVAIAGGVRAVRAASRPGVAALAGMVALLVSGSVNTLVDEPRFLWLALVLAWLCRYHGKAVWRQNPGL